MGKLFYVLFTKLYPLGARVLMLFNKKAALWVNGRRGLLQRIGGDCKADNTPKIWVHASSLGEFEQGRPLIDELRAAYPGYKIVLTFFSPSGYEVQKNYKGADYVYYMPMDSFANARLFFDAVKPRLVVFIKYEFWYYYLNEASRRSVPLLLVSGIFRSSQPFFKSWGNFHRGMLKCFTHLFVQTQQAADLLAEINITNVSVAGDTRFDRVLQLAANPRQFQHIATFCAGKKVIVAGSTWTNDDEELDHYANTHPEYRFIIAPHDIGEERLHECDTLYKHSIRYSAYIKKIENNEAVDAAVNTIIIDNIGTLKYLYAYATVCYVGGGFGGDGVHNVAEAAVYYKPVVFGPTYEKFAEAVGLVQDGGAFDVDDALDLEGELDDLLTNDELYKKACTASGDYIKKRGGATSQVMHYIQEKRLLTS